MQALADNSDRLYVSNVARSVCFTFCIMVSLKLLWHKLSSHRFCLMRSEGPTSTATGRWMKTSPSASPSIKVSVAFTTASTLMSPSSISQGTARSDLFSLSFITKYVSLSKSKYQRSFKQTLCDRGTALLSSLFCVHNRVALILIPAAEMPSIQAKKLESVSAITQINSPIQYHLILF